MLSPAIASLVNLHKSLSQTERLILDGQVAETARTALDHVYRTVPVMPELKFKESPKNLSIRFGYHPMERALPLRPGTSLQWGVSDLPSKTVTVAPLACFAPRDVLRALVTHEACHIVYSMIDPASIGTVALGLRARDYSPDRQFEEQWVTNLNTRLGCDEYAMVAWIFAVQDYGADWPKVFEEYRLRARTIAAADPRAE
jgi:hypothetical protein